MDDGDGLLSAENMSGFADQVPVVESLSSALVLNATEPGRDENLRTLSQVLHGMSLLAERVEEEYRMVEQRDPFGPDVRAGHPAGEILVVLEDGLHQFPANFALALQDRNLRQRLAGSPWLVEAIAAGFRLLSVWMSADDRAAPSRLNLDEVALENMIEIVKSRRFLPDEGILTMAEVLPRRAFSAWCMAFLSLLSEFSEYTGYFLVEEVIDVFLTELARMVEETREEAVDENCISPGLALGFKGEVNFYLRLIATVGAYQVAFPATMINDWQGIRLALQLVCRFKGEVDSATLEETLRMMCTLCAHRGYAIEFVRRKGVSALLEIPRYANSVCSPMLSLFVSSLMSTPGVMEEMCGTCQDQMPDLMDLIIYLTCEVHDTARKNGSLAIASGVIHPMFIRIFRSSDGIGLLLDVIRSAVEVRGNQENPRPLIGGLHGYASRSCALNAAFALRQYFRAELLLLQEKLRSGKRRVGHNPFSALTINYQTLQAAAQAVRKAARRGELRWAAGEAFFHRRGPRILADLVCAGMQWDMSEVSANALEVLEIVTLLPQFSPVLPASEDTGCGFPGSQEEMMNPRQTPGEEPESISAHVMATSVVASILQAIGSKVQGDGAVVVSALRCICNMVHPAGWCLPIGPAEAARANEDDGLRAGREAVRSNGGISPLMWRLHIQTPATKADKIRHLACRSLLGLSRVPSVLQVLTSHQISDELSDLISRGPTLGENRAFFDMFREEALELIARTTGRAAASLPTEASDHAMRKIERAAIASSSLVTYPEHELLYLIHDHLIRQNLHKTAAQLVEEMTTSRHLVVSKAQSTTLEPFPSVNNMVIPRKRMRFPRLRPGEGAVSHTKKRSNSIRNNKSREASSGPSMVTLDGIVKHCLVSQHSSCPLPMAAPPSFSLLQPHRCPHLPLVSDAQTHATRILYRREIGGHWNDLSTKRDLRRFAFSRFRPKKTFHDSETDRASCAAFIGPTALAESSVDEALLIGGSTGTVTLFSEYSTPTCQDGRWDLSFNCITHLEASETHSLLLTCSLPVGVEAEYRGGLALWNFKRMPDPFSDPEHMEERAPLSPLYSLDAASEYGCFSNGEDRILSSRRDQAAIYNAETGQQLGLLSSPSQLQHPPETRVRMTKACWSPNDDLILHNGSLWDPRRNRRIHRFESLSGIDGSGVIHRNGLEVIVNTEVWDLRTFRLLRTCPALHGTEMQFNSIGDVIFAAPLFSSRSAAAYRKSGTVRDPLRDTCFRSVDAQLFEELSTNDVESPIMNLAVEGRDRYLGITEKVDGGSLQESVLRLYEIGRKRRSFDADDGDEESDPSANERSSDEELDRDEEQDSNGGSEFDDDYLMVENDDFLAFMEDN